MKKRFSVFLFLAASVIPFASYAGSWATGVNAFNTASGGNASKSADGRKTDWWAKKIDDAHGAFVFESARFDRVLKRFEEQLSSSGIAISEKVQFTKAVKFTFDDASVYETWGVNIYKNREGVDKVAATRYLVFCGQNMIGEPTSIYFNIEDNVRTVDKYYFLIDSWNEKNDWKSMANLYKEVCSAAN